MAKWRIRWQERLGSASGMDDTIFDDYNIDTVVNTLAKANPLMFISKVPVEVDVNVGKKQISVVGYRARRDFRVSDQPPLNFTITKGTEMRVGIHDNKQALLLNLSGMIFPFDVKIVTDPEFEKYFEKMYEE